MQFSIALLKCVRPALKNMYGWEHMFLLNLYIHFKLMVDVQAVNSTGTNGPQYQQRCRLTSWMVLLYSRGYGVHVLQKEFQISII